MYVCLKLILFYPGFIYYTWNDQNNTQNVKITKI